MLIGQLTLALVSVFAGAALEQPARMQTIREAARATAIEKFDLERVLLPRWMALFDDLIHHRRPRTEG